MDEIYSEKLYRGIPKEGYIYTVQGMLHPILYIDYDNLAIMEGDIILSSSEKMEQWTKSIRSSKRNELENVIRACGITVSGSLWPDSTVYYEIAPDCKKRGTILDAINYYHTVTEIKFIERTASNPDYVKFVNSDGCSSYVGKQGDMQEINIADWATMGNVAHEMMHALGYWHEQSREDRDFYITLHLENLTSDSYKHNFDKMGIWGRDLDTYDYNSLMHYSKGAFAKSGKDTIVPIDSSASIGNRDGFSTKDRLGLQALYTCANQNPIIALDVIVGDSPSIPVQSGYVKINQELNEGSGGKYIYLCFKKGTPQDRGDAITDIRVIMGDKSSVPVPEGYQKIDIDLNRGAGGKYIYICYKKGGEAPITNVTVVSGKSDDILREVGYDFYGIPQDLNCGAKGKYIYLCYQRDITVPVTDVTIISGDNINLLPPDGYDRTNVDLNRGSKGKYIFACVKRGYGQNYVKDLAVISGSSGNIKAPDGFVKIEKDLNEGAKGKYIYLCKQFGDTSIKDLMVIEGNIPSLQAPPGWAKINHDLNEGAKGKYIYFCVK